MLKSVLHMVSAVLAGALLSGCAAYPVVQVAGGAMTGYDAAMLADEYLPRNHVEGGELCFERDKVLERRLRERLDLNKMTVSAHVIDGKAYLIGPVKDRNHADYAIETAATVDGIKTITCKFYRPPSNRQARKDEEIFRELTGRLDSNSRLQATDLRVEIVRRDAIIIGRTVDYGQKAEALAIASEIGDIKNVIDYISVTEPPEGATPGKKIASN